MFQDASLWHQLGVEILGMSSLLLLWLASQARHGVS